MVEFKRTDEMVGTAERTIETALNVIREREQTHGNKREVLNQIARLWRAYIGVPVDAHQVATMMVLLKIARSQNGEHNPDDFVDAVGYAALAAEAREWK